MPFSHPFETTFTHLFTFLHTSSSWCALAWHTLEDYSEVPLSRKHANSWGSKKRGERAGGLVLFRFFYKFIYVFYQNVIQIERWAFAWQRAEEQRGSPRERQYPYTGAPSPPPPPPNIAIFFIQTYKHSTAHPTTLLLNMTIKRGSQALCITI